MQSFVAGQFDDATEDGDQSALLPSSSATPDNCPISNTTALPTMKESVKPEHDVPKSMVEIRKSHYEASLNFTDSVISCDHARCISPLTTTASVTGDDTKFEMEIVDEIRPDDVLFGRGKGPNNHVGNVRFRDLILLHRKKYLSYRKRCHKGDTCKTIVGIISSRGGRFLKKLASGQWAVVSTKKAIGKTSQALREGVTRNMIVEEEAASVAHSRFPDTNGTVLVAQRAHSLPAIGLRQGTLHYTYSDPGLLTLRDGVWMARGITRL